MRQDELKQLHFKSDSFVIIKYVLTQNWILFLQWIKPVNSAFKDHDRLLFFLSACFNAHHLVLFRDDNSLFLHPSRCPWIPTPPWTPTHHWSGLPACHPVTGPCSPTSRSWNCPPTPNGSFLARGKKKNNRHCHLNPVRKKTCWSVAFFHAARQHISESTDTELLSLYRYVLWKHVSRQYIKVTMTPFSALILLAS